MAPSGRGMPELSIRGRCPRLRLDEPYGLEEKCRINAELRRRAGCGERSVPTGRDDTVPTSREETCDTNLRRDRDIAPYLEARVK